MKKLLKHFILGIIAALIFSSTLPVYADRSGNELQGMMNYLNKDEKQAITNHLNVFNIEIADNNSELSKENKHIISKTLENPQKYFFYADIINSETIILLNTEEKNTQVAITDNIVEVVERVDENTFLINGEKNHFEISVSDEAVNPAPSDNVLKGGIIQANDGWIKVGSRPGPWSFESGKWVNVNASRDFHTYTAASLGSVLAAFMAPALGLGFGGTLVMGIAVGAAYNYVAASRYPTNVGKSYVSFFRNGPIPVSDRRVWSSNYAIHDGNETHLGITESFYTRCIGCGG